MIKLFQISILLFCFQAKAVQENIRDEVQAVEFSEENLISEGLPYIAVKASESWLILSNDPNFEKQTKFALLKAQKRADSFCQSLKFLQALKVEEADLDAFETVEGWVVDSPDQVSVSLEERKLSQLSWISMLTGSFAYRDPLIFNKILCTKH